MKKDRFLSGPGASEVLGATMGVLWDSPKSQDKQSLSDTLRST